MARKGQLASRGKDPHPVVGLGTIGGQHEDRFGQIDLLGDALHVRGIEGVAAKNHSGGITPERLVAKGINHEIGQHEHPLLFRRKKTPGTGPGALTVQRP